MSPDELELLLVRCHRRWPAIPPAAPDSALRRRQAAPSVAGSSSEGFYAEEFWLAAACAEGLPAALTELDRLLVPLAAAAALRLDSSPSFADEVAQAVRERIFPGAGGRARLADYTGRGSLAGWLRAVALRAALTQLRRRGARPTSEISDGQLGISGDPELELLRQRFRGDFSAALAAALQSLDPQERSFLRLHLVEGVGIDRLAASARVHRSTVVRRLATARSNVLRRTRARLVTSLRLEPAEVDSLIAQLQSQLDVSLGRMLQTGG